MTIAYVYLLHFDHPGGRHPQHYLGVARDVDQRFAEHCRGSSKSRLTRACHEKGIGVRLVWSKKFRYAKAAFDYERAVKQRKKSYACMCPACKVAA